MRKIKRKKKSCGLKKIKNENILKMNLKKWELQRKTNKKEKRKEIRNIKYKLKNLSEVK